jgi:ubiquinone/menaquinone biosynthesis C-methylase UbiE
MSPDRSKGSEAIRERWDELSKTYDEGWETLSGAARNYVDWELLKGYLPKNRNARILEVAGGTGRITLPLAKLGYSVTLCDISYGMLSVAKRKLLQEGVLNRVEISQCDARNLHFRDESFDFSLCWFGVIDATRELVRVTKRGARISIFLHNRCKEAIKLFSRDPEAALALLKSPSKLLNTDEDEYYNIAIRAEDAVKLFKAEGVRVLNVYAVDLMQVLLSEEVRGSKQWDEGYFSQVAEMALGLSQEPSIKGMSGVMVVYGQRI